jgi:DNA-binding NtrC family response regulator
MELIRKVEQADGTTSCGMGVTPKLLREARALIVCKDVSITKQLSSSLQEADFVSEHVESMTRGCSAARSGQFQVVLATPVLADGSWTRLTDIANHYNLAFVVVLLASTFDFNQRTDALNNGAFDVLDVVHELPNAAQIAKRALWAAYLKGSGLCPRTADLPKAS